VLHLVNKVGGEAMRYTWLKIPYEVLLSVPVHCHDVRFANLILIEHHQLDILKHKNAVLV